MKRTQVFAAFAILIQQLLVPWAMASSYSQQSSGQVEGFVIPTSVHANEPFTFAAKGSVEGEVVDIKTVEGEVVQTKKTDKYGRVFLAGGLAAGVYLLSHSVKGGGAGKVQMPIEIINPGSPSNPSNALSFKMPKFVSQKDGLHLSGTGFSGNAADLVVSSGNTSYPVLASTPRELKTGALSNLKPGAKDFNIKNLKTGDQQQGHDATVYAIQSKLTQQRVANGQLTMLEFTVQPKSVEAVIKAKIDNGPVHFSGGGKETNVTVKNGSAKVPLLADPTGSGKFNVSWEMANIMVSTVPGKTGGDNPGSESNEPCPATIHKMKPTGVWKAAGKDGELWVATRARQCYVRTCKLKKGHGGEHDYAAEKRCPDKEEDVEEKTFETEEARAKFIKDSKAGGG